MANCGRMARLAAAAAAVLITSCLTAQTPPPGGTNPPNVPPSGTSASQNTMQPPNTPDSAGATDAMGNASTGMGSQQAMDKDFVRKMIMGNHAEIDAGNLALQKSSNDDVKKFAQKMVTDHTAMLDDMTRLAEQLQIKAPQAASPKDKAEAAKMSALSGSAFDNAYVKAMVKDHKKDVSELKNESSNASIPPVKDAASKALPIVQSHLDMIEGIQKNMTSASGSASTK